MCMFQTCLILYWVLFDLVAEACEVWVCDDSEIHCVFETDHCVFETCWRFSYIHCVFETIHCVFDTCCRFNSRWNWNRMISHATQVGGLWCWCWWWSWRGATRADEEPLGGTFSIFIGGSPYWRRGATGSAIIYWRHRGAAGSAIIYWRHRGATRGAGDAFIESTTPRSRSGSAFIGAHVKSIYLGARHVSIYLGRARLYIFGGALVYRVRSS